MLQLRRREKAMGCGGILQEGAIRPEFLRGTGAWHIREISSGSERPSPGGGNLLDRNEAGVVS